MNQLHREAIIKAGQIRRKVGLDMFQPVNIFDICIDLGIDVKFVDVNMEGLYINQNGIPMILISNQRPLPRKIFTCGHELGHHVFNHGLKADILSDESGHSVIKDRDEVLVDSFSAAFLMPVAGIQFELSKRNWDLNNCTPIQISMLSSIFGVGYQTLVIHCRVNGLLSENRCNELLKWTPAKIFKNYFGEVADKSYFKILDNLFELNIVDLEVGNYIIVPSHFEIEENSLEYFFDCDYGSVYRTTKAGIFTVQNLDKETSFFVRVQKENYIGFAEYRHFEN
ncbi:ImmA/IrrE family metallo-endopeptidase [Flavobacterium sp. ANB]|uniref:ImmA/IrrE family metallo-endopeptidase n=1 Tax=Flavobacterium sp. ANB TaxID=2783790 RepID=UPI00188A758F|nr:ImmA/IrrE family metallo-endopeptidase [Flavobacterium sp. ANB]MBF4519167.1 ImmA/IrrE family metallo-endopeptidase [Flavobacterium sp. ANB]